MVNSEELHSFRFITVTVSLLLGLGISRILVGFAEVFQNRQIVRVRGLPLIWGFCVFVLQIQFWWAMIELDRTVAIWKFVHFLALISLPIFLFIASILIFPVTYHANDLDQQEVFHRDGRWGLLALSLYSVMAVFMNQLFFGVGPWSVGGAMNTGMAILPLAYTGSSRPMFRYLITALFVLLLILSAAFLSPAAYH